MLQPVHHSLCFCVMLVQASQAPAPPVSVPSCQHHIRKLKSEIKGLVHMTDYTRCMCATGLSIVSPPWLLRSLAQGTPDRCLHMSLDASRHLPTPAQPTSPASGDQHAWSNPGSSLHSASLLQDLSDRQTRERFVQQLQEREALQQWGETPLPAPLPAPACLSVSVCLPAPLPARLPARLPP